MKRTISKALMAAGALLILGAAGDSDAGRLTFEGTLLKVMFGTSLFMVGYILYKKAKSPEQSSEGFAKHISLDSKQATTPAYSNKFTTESAECQPYPELKMARNEVTGC